MLGCKVGAKKALIAQREVTYLRYKVSAKKGLIAQREVTYIGYKLRGGWRWLAQAMKDTILKIPQPISPRQVREFLGSVRYCRLWIPGFAEIAQPLYKGSKESPDWTWSPDMDTAFQHLRQAILRTPALASPTLKNRSSCLWKKSTGWPKGSSPNAWAPATGQLPTCPNDWILWPLAGHPPLHGCSSGPLGQRC